MKLLLIGYFDAGVSVDVDDRCFEGDAMRDIRARFGSLDPGIRQGAAWPDGNEVALGRGVAVDLLGEHGPPWLLAAIEWARASEDDEDRDLVPLLERLHVERCELRVFSLGLSLVALQVGGIPRGHERDFIRIGRILEWASYGQERANAAYTGIVTKLQGIAKHILDSAGMKGSLASLTARIPTYGEPASGYVPVRVASGYWQIVIEEDGDDHAAILATATEYEGQRGLSKLDMDDATVWLGWAVTIVGPPKSADVDRIVALLDLCQLFYGLAESFEVLLTRRFLHAARQSFDRPDDTLHRDIHSLYRLRMLALALIGVTSFAATTNNISDWMLLDAFEERAHIRDRHARIAHAAEIFADAEAQLVRERDEIRAQKVRQVLAVIAALGIIGVVAAVIDVVQIPPSTMAIELRRLGFMLASAVLALAVAGWILLGKTRL